MVAQVRKKTMDQPSEPSIAEEVRVPPAWTPPSSPRERALGFCHTAALMQSESTNDGAIRCYL